MENLLQNFMLLYRSYNLHLVLFGFSFLSGGIQASHTHTIVILTLLILLNNIYHMTNITIYSIHLVFI